MLSLPLMGVVSVKKDARALYIGHVYLHLDEFFELTGVRVADESAQEENFLRAFRGWKKSIFMPAKIGDS